MLFPNKLFKYEESVLSKLPAILASLQEGHMPIKDLYSSCKNHFSGASEFVEALDCLYALGKIKVNSEKEVELC